MSHSNEKPKTGIFYTQDPAGVVVMQHGEIVQHYKNVMELVDAHVKGIAALEHQMEEELTRHYKSP